MNDTDINEIFASNLKFYVKLKGVTYSELAKEIGVGKSTVSNWLKGLSLPRMSKIDSICNYLDISRTALLEKNIEKELDKAFLSSRPNEADKEIIKDAINIGVEPDKVEYYLNSNDFTSEELEKIMEYAKFIKSQRS